MKKAWTVFFASVLCLFLSSCFSIVINPAENTTSSTTTTVTSHSEVATSTTTQVYWRWDPPQDPDIEDFKRQKDKIDSEPWNMDGKEIQITGYLSYAGDVPYLDSSSEYRNPSLRWFMGGHTFKLDNFDEKHKLYSGHKITVKGKLSLDIDSDNTVLKTIVCNHVELKDE